MVGKVGRGRWWGNRGGGGGGEIGSGKVVGR